MARLNKQDIAQLADDELVEKIKSMKQLYQQKKFNHVIAQLDNPLELRMMRKDIARLLTELRKRQLAKKEK